jgi:hypothetical protein
MQLGKKCRFRHCDHEIHGRRQYCSSQHKYLEGVCRREDGKTSHKGYGAQQRRMDKAAARYARRTRRGNNTVRYW